MADHDVNEAELIQQALNGELESFNTLVLLHQDRVYSLAYRIMGEGESAADATQEAFITAYRRLSSYRGGNFRSWLLRIVTNTCYDELRRRKRRPATAMDDLPGGDSADGPYLPGPDSTPEERAQLTELRTAIENCIRLLGDEQRTVLVLSDVEGWSYQEIAESVGLRTGTVKSRLSRARLNVRRCLQGFEELLPDVYRLRDDG